MPDQKSVRLSLLIEIIALVCISCMQAGGQTATTAIQSADKLFQEKRWTDAAKAYEAILSTTPDNAQAWYQLAMSHYWLNQMPAAAEALLKNINITKSSTSMFNLACVYARMNDKDKAFEWLGKAFAPGNGAAFSLDLNDSDLSTLRDDSRYRELAASVDKQTHPCKYSLEAQQFDFFVGEWDAFNPQGRKDGTSVIQKISDGCGILENWTNVYGPSGGGKSINFFDPTQAKWFQYWIGSDGNPQRFSGVYKDGALRFEGEPKTLQNGKKIVRHLTFFNIDANTVRQLSEWSSDDGKTWNVGYDYKYVRRNAN